MRVIFWGLLILTASPWAISQPKTAECSNLESTTRWSGCQGVFIDRANGLSYAGQFLNGVFHGTGTSRSPDGVYVGEFVEGLFDGFGIFTTSDGQRYIGQFRNGEIAGVGRLLDPQGVEIFSGEFVAGRPVLRPQEAPPQNVMPERPQLPARPKQQPVTPAPVATAAARPPPPPPPPSAPPSAPATVASRSSVEASSPAPKMIPRRGSLDGLDDGVYLRTQMFGSSLVTEVFQINGNQIARGPKKKLKENEFIPSNADKIGTIRTAENQVIIRWIGDSDEDRHRYKKNDRCPNFRGGIVCKVETFQPGERVGGTFRGTIGSNALSQSVRLQLRQDGTYTLTRVGIVNAPSTGAVSEGVENGRYSLEASTLRLQPSNGGETEYLVFPYPAKEPKYLWLGDRMLEGAVLRDSVR